MLWVGNIGVEIDHIDNDLNKPLNYEKAFKRMLDKLGLLKGEIMEGNITITKKEYLSLRIDSERLARLEDGGVDNWDWYGEALNPANEPNMEDWEIKERERIDKL